jgi:hypothetical protein
MMRRPVAGCHCPTDYQSSEEMKQMEPRLSLGIVISVFLTIAFGVYCLYSTTALPRPGDQVHREARRPRDKRSSAHESPSERKEFLESRPMEDAHRSTRANRSCATCCPRGQLFAYLDHLLSFSPVWHSYNHTGSTKIQTLILDSLHARHEADQ